MHYEAFKLIDGYVMFNLTNSDLNRAKIIDFRFIEKEEFEQFKTVRKLTGKAGVS